MTDGGVVYVITNKMTGARYIGLTVRPLAKRWCDHRSAAKRGKTPLYRAMRKYGEGAFSISPIASASTFGELKALETALIAQEKTRVQDGGYNLTAGGDGTRGKMVSEETRQKLRAANQRAMSPERRASLSVATTKQMADPNSRLLISAANSGRVCSEETRRKLSVSGKKRPAKSQETRASLSAALRGKKRPAEVCAKIAEGKRGRAMPDGFGHVMSKRLRGKKKSESHRAAMRAAWVVRKQGARKCAA